MKTCQSCGAHLETHQPVCPYCGNRNPFYVEKKEEKVAPLEVVIQDTALKDHHSKWLTLLAVLIPILASFIIWILIKKNKPLMASSIAKGIRIRIVLILLIYIPGSIFKCSIR